MTEKYKIKYVYDLDKMNGYYADDIVTRVKDADCGGELGIFVSKVNSPTSFFFCRQLEEISDETIQEKIEKENIVAEKANSSATGSLRYNVGKVDPTHLDYSFVMEMARVLTLNEGKYPKYNYAKGQNYSTSLASLMRHLVDFMNGKDVDESDGADMLAKIAVNAMITYCTKKYHLADNPEYDDRLLKVLGKN